MTLSRITFLFGICSVALASGLGCRDALPAAQRESAIHFVIRPNPNVRSDPPSGSFDVRGIDNDEHTHVGIGSSSARTLHVRLPPGSYAVAWNPASADPIAAAAEATDASAPAWPQIIVVTTDSPATVDVHLAPRGAHAEPSYELAAAEKHAALGY